jgi:hypothetical protein
MYSQQCRQLITESKYNSSLNEPRPGRTSSRRKNSSISIYPGCYFRTGHQGPLRRLLQSRRTDHSILQPCTDTGIEWLCTEHKLVRRGEERTGLSVNATNQVETWVRVASSTGGNELMSKQTDIHVTTQPTREKKKISRAKGKMISRDRTIRRGSRSTYDPGKFGFNEWEGCTLVLLSMHATSACDGTTPGPGMNPNGSFTQLKWINYVRKGTLDSFLLYTV